MHAVGRLGPARQFFSLKVRRQESSKSAGRCSTLGKGTEEKKLAGRAQPGQSRAGAGLPAGYADLSGYRSHVVRPAVEGGSSRQHILATLWLLLGMLSTFWLLLGMLLWGCCVCSNRCWPSAANVFVLGMLIGGFHSDQDLIRICPWDNILFQVFRSLL